MSLETDQFAFGEFVLDTKEKVLLRQGKSLPITPKVFHLLSVLIENHGHLVEKTTLMEKVWADSFVEESNLTFNIRQLRKILGDDKQHPRFIETIPRRGYRFIAEVDEVSLRNGQQANGGRLYSDIKTHPPINGWRTRPIFYATCVVLAVVSLLSAGFFVLSESDSRLGLLLPRTVPDYSELKFEAVTSSGESPLAHISLDGRYIAYLNTANGQQSIWIRQLSSGVNTQVVPPTKDVRFLGIEFSPDGEKICFVRLQNKSMYLDCVSILGGNAQQNIISGLQGWFSLSRDGSKVSYIIHKDYQGNLFVADSSGANPRRIYTTPNIHTITDNAFSPSGKTIAFASGQSNTAGKEFGVYVIDANGENLRPATDFKWAHVRGVFWLPDESGLLAVATETPGGPSQLWKISIPGGEVSKITNAVSSFSSISASADLQKILLIQVRANSMLYLASMSDPDDVRPIAQAAAVAWTNDGNLIYAADSSGNRDIWRFEKDRSDQKQLTVEPGIDQLPAVSPDGRFIVFVSNRTGKNAIWRMNSDGTDPVPLTGGDGESDPVFTADGRFVLFNSLQDLSLWKIPVEGGEPIKMPVENAHVTSISPDGEKFAHIKRQPGEPKLLIRNFDTCEIDHEFDFPSGYALSTPKTVWTRDGKGLIYALEDLSAVANLWLQPLSGGDPQKLTNFNSEEIFDLSLSPDGQQIAVVRGSWKHDAVLLKGFRP